MLILMWEMRRGHRLFWHMGAFPCKLVFFG